MQEQINKTQIELEKKEQLIKMLRELFLMAPNGEMRQQIVEIAGKVADL